MIADVGAGGSHGFGCSLKLAGMYLEYMPQAIEYLKLGLDMTSLCGKSKPLGIIEQNLLATDLNQ
jgi:hypothetical protein